MERIQKIRPLDAAAMRAAKARWDSIAKPLNSLGRLETLVEQIAGIQETERVSAAPRCALVFCADNGVLAEGVAQSGSEVTALVARAVAQGEANVNLMARVAGAEAFAVDIGMEQDVEHPRMLQRKIARGTGNIAREPAMGRDQALRALETGMDVVGEMAGRGYRMIAVGEMGIGNTTTASAVLAALLGLPPEQVTGRGSGLSDEGLRRKIEAIRRALAVNRPNPADALDVLAKLGGYDIAGMAGAFLGGAAYRTPMVVDGLISSAAALIAVRLCPAARDFMLASHVSREPAGPMVLNALGLAPVVHAEMALGEGTGAVTLFPLIDMALAVYGGPHTFGRMGMEAYAPQEGRP